MGEGKRFGLSLVIISVGDRLVALAALSVLFGAVQVLEQPMLLAATIAVLSALESAGLQKGSWRRSPLSRLILGTS
jgi:hypothetical protein